MSGSPRNVDPLQALTDHAEHLNAISSAAWRPKVFYETMSGSLVWSDETKDDTPIEVIWALRFLWAYRTSVLLDKPRDELKAWWEHGLSLFPNWVGFRPKRRKSTPKLLEIYRRGDAGLRKCLRDIEREMNRNA